MGKSSSPKDIMEKRIKNSKLLMLPPPVSPAKSRVSIIIHNKKYEIHNREIKDDGFPNPYSLPNRLRLFTKEVPPRKKRPLPDFIDDVRTVCDIDKYFYKVVEGRPLRQLDDIKVYMTNIRDLVDCRTNIGFLRDEMERIDHDLRQETEKLQKIETLCNSCSASYVKFLKQSFALAINKQEEAAKVVIKLDKMTDRLEEYSFQYVRLRNGLGVVMGNYEKLLRYKNFLTSLAPNWWQAQFNEQSNENRVAKICAKLSSNLDIISKTSTDRSDTSLAHFKPILFFRKPYQVMSVFDTMGRQGQHYLAIVNKTAGILSKVRKLKAGFETTLKQSSVEMQEDVEKYSNIVAFMEEKEKECKRKFYKILLNDFKQLYSDYENIKLHTCVQYIYTSIFGNSDDVIDETIAMMGHLESLYMKLSSRMDFLDVNIVNAATKQLFAQDIEMMAKARNAHWQLQLSDILRKSLYTSFEPPRNRTRKSKI